MLLAVSTLGCPELTLGGAAALAAECGYSALEVRAAANTPVNISAGRQQRQGWRDELEARSIKALALSSYVKLCDTTVDDDHAVGNGIAHLKLAHDLGATWLRVFPGGTRGVVCSPEVEERGARRLAALSAVSQDLGVGLAVETHDSHPRAVDVNRLIDLAGASNVGAIWDVLHTWLSGETPQETVTLLGDRLAYVQVKDVASRESLSPLSLGDGILPLRDCLDLVRSRSLTSWVSWEYERVWHPQAPALGRVAAAGCQWLTKALELNP